MELLSFLEAILSDSLLRYYLNYQWLSPLKISNKEHIFVEAVKSIVVADVNKAKTLSDSY